MNTHPVIARATVQIAFPPSLALIDRTIRWLSDFCNMTLHDLELASRFQLAVYELVENVVKYGLTPNVQVDVSVEQAAGGTVLSLRTRNKADPDRMEEAVRLLTSIRDAEDPVAFYDQLVLETAPKSGVSGLGLARIRAEAELDLDFEVNSDQELCITVQALLKPGKS